MMRRRWIGFAWVVAVVLLVPAYSAMAMGGKGGGASVVIDSVQFFDLKGGKKRIEIMGGGFTNGASPTVTLDDAIDLTVVDYSTTTISANVPPNTSDGDYSLMVSTGGLSKQNAATPIHLGGTLSVVCLDWYLTTGVDQHIHVEGFVQDENGDAVIGAPVTLENTVNGDLYQLKTSTTFKYAGYSHGESCPLEVARASGATGQFCCIGNATDPPDDSSSCFPGLYESFVVSVEPPPGSDRRWDGVQPEANSRVFNP